MPSNMHQANLKIKDKNHLLYLKVKLVKEFGTEVIKMKYQVQDFITKKTYKTSKKKLKELSV